MALFANVPKELEASVRGLGSRFQGANDLKYAYAGMAIAVQYIQLNPSHPRH
jgi:hypothetical protein